MKKIIILSILLSIFFLTSCSNREWNEGNESNEKAAKNQVQKVTKPIVNNIKKESITTKQKAEVTKVISDVLKPIENIVTK